MILIHIDIFHDVLRQALSSLKENKLRTILSVLGITVGITAVMVVGTVSDGVNKYIYAELDTYGLETIWIYREWEDENPFRSIREGSGIDNADLSSLRSCCPSVRRVSPVVYSDQESIQMRSKGTYSNVYLEGVGTDYLEINHDRVTAGRDLIKNDIQSRKPVAIIGSKVSDELFGKHTSPLKRTIRWGDVRLMVIGILEDKNRDILSRIGADDLILTNVFSFRTPYTSSSLG